MKKSPLVSVIISFYNAQTFIEEAIESVFSQKFNDWELLLVDDGSCDSSSKIARSFAELHPMRVQYLTHPNHRNIGLPASRNAGMARAKGRYIAILDADDIWLPRKLERQVEILNSHPQVAMVYGNTLYWHSWDTNAKDTQNDTIVKQQVGMNRVHEPPNLFKRYLKSIAGSPCPSDLLFRKDRILDLGGFEENFRGMYAVYEDIAFLSKVYLNTAVYVADECLDKYRLHPDSLCAVQSRQGNDRLIRLFYLKWLEEYLIKKNVKDAEIWRSYRRMVWLYKHPLLYRLLRQAPGLIRVVKWLYNR